MLADPEFSIHSTARPADAVAQLLDRAIGPLGDMEKLDDCADWPDDIGVDSEPWHQTACRQTALFIEDTY